MAGGSNELGFAKASSAASGPCTRPRMSPAWTMGGAASRERSNWRKSSAIPVACFETHKSGVGGVGVLGDAAAAQPVKNVLGQHDPGSIGIDAVIVAGAGSASNW